EMAPNYPLLRLWFGSMGRLSLQETNMQVVTGASWTRLPAFSGFVIISRILGETQTQSPSLDNLPGALVPPCW
uniref:Uncharacterized protein n=1 Tax=Salmo trutta TaxID=8032 RepID=A0A674A7L3_SALTR